MGVTVRSGYADIRDDELPTADVLRAFLAATNHPLFKLQEEVADADGRIVEFELKSGFRAPIQPSAVPLEAPKEPKELIQTVRRYTEEALVNAPPNPEDIALAQSVSYSSEIYEFLLFSISKDIATDASGAILDAKFEPLREAITTRDPTLLRAIKDWFKLEGHAGKTERPVSFVNKVRTPCGQFKTKPECAGSSLCGWHKGTCKIRVNPIVDNAKLLARIATTLRTNDKQRALVLDGRMSPFFSSMLYLEMPHEWITTDVTSTPS
jgi:hypothetical protein